MSAKCYIFFQSFQGYGGRMNMLFGVKEFTSCLGIRFSNESCSLSICVDNKTFIGLFFVNGVTYSNILICYIGVLFNFYVQFTRWEIINLCQCKAKVDLFYCRPGMSNSILWAAKANKTRMQVTFKKIWRLKMTL